MQQDIGKRCYKHGSPGEEIIQCENEEQRSKRVGTCGGRFPQAFGVGTAGSGGVAPEAVAVTPAYIGNSKFAIGVNNALPGTLAFFLLDFAAAPFPIPFLGQNFYLAMTPASQFYFAGLTQGAAVGAGYTSIRLPIPSDPGLTGAPIFAQWMIADPNGPSGLSSSGAVTTTLF